MSDKVRLEYEGPIAVITNDNAEKHNAFDDEMDLRLFAILDELCERPDVRAVIWRGEGKSFSSGRDVAAIGGQQVELTHHELMSRGHRGTFRHLRPRSARSSWPCTGGRSARSFQRALLCDIRIAAEGARFMLPEVTHGVIPDTGGMGRLFQICGHGVATDMVLTGRADGRRRGYAHGVVSRVVEPDALDDTALGDGAQDRRGARGVGEDGAPGDQAPVGARDPIVDGGGDDRPDVHRQVGRHGRVQGRACRRPRAALHGELTR